MDAVGIVCEYNPFHSGHLRHLELSRALAGRDSVIVCAMSGDYVQRGEAAVYDKFSRAEAACLCGADLVIELPLPWCLSSAERFAAGSVQLLADMGCRYLSFGSESGDLEALQLLADYVADPATLERIHHSMDRDSTLSFAAAREKAARERFGEKAKLLRTPNDILAVEYLKAIKKTGTDMQPLPVRRSGAEHDALYGGELRSAMHLREMIRAGEDPADFIPAAAAEIFRREREAGKTQEERLLANALLSRLYLLRAEDFDGLPDAGGGAGRRLYKSVQSGCCPAEIAYRASGRRFTAARMRRMLLCAALGIRKEDSEEAPPYARVLAADAAGRAWLHSTGERTGIPVLTKPASVRKLGKKAAGLFEMGARAHDLYGLGFLNADHFQTGEDWRRSPVIVQNDGRPPKLL